METTNTELRPKRKKYGIYLITGIIFLIVIIISTLLYLNNSNNIKNSASKELNLQENNSLITDPKFKNYTKLTNQTSDTQMVSYIMLINQKRIPTDNPDYPEEIYGIFSGFDDKYIQIITYNGIKNLSYNKDLNILKQGKVEKSATSSGVNIGFSNFDKKSFFSQSMFGKTLHLSITPKTPATILQIYLTE